jgi:hypothetical protein
MRSGAGIAHSAKEIHVSKHKNNGANRSEEIEQKEALEISAIQDVDGNAYVFTLWACSSEMPGYGLHITAIGEDQNACRFAVDTYSLQKLTAWFARAVRRVSKSEAIKSTQIQDTDGKAHVFALLTDPLRIPRHQLDISVLGDPDDGIGIVVDLYGVQKLTAWFAEAALRASKYEADRSHS